MTSPTRAAIARLTEFVRVAKDESFEDYDTFEVDDVAALLSLLPEGRGEQAADDFYAEDAQLLHETWKASFQRVSADLSAARLRIKALRADLITARAGLESIRKPEYGIGFRGLKGLARKTLERLSAQGETKAADRYQEGYGDGYEQGAFDAVQSRDVPEGLPELPCADVSTLAPDPAHLREAALYLLKGVNVGSGSFGFYHGTRFVKLTATYLKDEPTVGTTAALASTCENCGEPASKDDPDSSEILAETGELMCPACCEEQRDANAAYEEMDGEPDAAALVEGETKANPARKSLSCSNPWCATGRLCVHCDPPATPTLGEG